MPISPEMLSPDTLPLNSSVSGIGLVMETFQATSSPFAMPAKIAGELPAAPWVPVSVPPEFFRLSVALRSPIGVDIVRFQFPSTAILSLLNLSSQNRNGFGIWAGSGGGIAHLAPDAQPSQIDAARAARIRLITRTRNATYCTANAATFPPSARPAPQRPPPPISPLHTP